MSNQPRYYGLAQAEEDAVERYVKAFLDADPEKDSPPTPPSEEFGLVAFWCQAELFRRTRPLLFYVGAAGIFVVLPLQLCLFIYGTFVAP
ncbi:MAG: hypothetical protein LW865_01555 [Betaproteobacteria bacterium]|jgi:hypothetical protein|nr:hypothetical protein [Rhodocyclaceae bacterium]MCE2721959.1 hypothetical protein [Betaproteobacteria bacterium]